MIPGYNVLEMKKEQRRQVWHTPQYKNNSSKHCMA